MIIKNAKELSVTKAREVALRVLEAGLNAIQTSKVLRAALTVEGNMLHVGGRSYDLRTYRRLYVVGVGKAALAAGEELEKLLGERITDGVILDVQSRNLRHMTSIAGTHPYPSRPNMKATGQIVGLLRNAGPNDLVLAIISGGGSALLCWPFEMDCEELTKVTQALIEKGATIQEVNIIRKHLSELQGGQLTRLVYPATLVGLIFSDVPGDDLSMVASGPTILDTTAVADAERVLEKYDVLRACRMDACNFIETPKDPAVFERTHNVLVVGNNVALRAMKEEAERDGYRAQVYSATLTGEAGEVGKILAKLPAPGECFVAGGETTVTVRAPGRGGRNLHVALGALLALPNGGLVISCASDGMDNGPLAGAIADVVTRSAAEAARLRPEEALERNSSYEFFERTGQNITTGPTGSNVSDLFISLREA